MPTGSEQSAAAGARREAELWTDIASTWTESAQPVAWAARSPLEHTVIPEHDPLPDLVRRSSQWGHRIRHGDLSELAAFAAGLAVAEADAWTAGDPVTATQALEARRFLFADRILPWAVPWLSAIRALDPPPARDTIDAMLELGELHRPAPSSGEGLHPPGFDGYGPEHAPSRLQARLRSLWGGMVRIDPDTDCDSVGGALVDEYLRAAVGWDQMAIDRPGSAANWEALAARARLTAQLVTSTGST